MGIDKNKEDKFTVVGRKLTDQAGSVPLGEDDYSFVVEANVEEFESDEDMDDSDDDSIV
jgi:hypothetical protein